MIEYISLYQRIKALKFFQTKFGTKQLNYD